MPDVSEAAFIVTRNITVEVTLHPHDPWPVCISAQKRCLCRTFLVQTAYLAFNLSFIEAWRGWNYSQQICAWRDSEKFSSSARTWRWNTDTHCEYSCLSPPPLPSVKKKTQWGTPTVAPPLLPPTLFYSHGSCSTDRGVRCWIRGTMQLTWLNLGAHVYYGAHCVFMCVRGVFWRGRNV